MPNDANQTTPRQRYGEHRRNARARGIPFLLTFDEWWAWWQVDGRWDRRGRRAGALVMARHGDVGPYALGNIYAATPHENLKESVAVGKVTDPDRWHRGAAMAAAAWRAKGVEHHTKDRERHHLARPVTTPDGAFPSAALAADHYGIKPSAATRRATLNRYGWSYTENGPANQGNLALSIGKA